MRNWLIGTIIIGSIFYVLAGKVQKEYSKIIQKDYEIVANYTNLLTK
jgi:hypothetical protein